MRRVLVMLLKYLAAISFAVGLLVWSIFTYKLFSEILGKAEVLPSKIGPTAEYAKFGDVFTAYLYLGVALGAGLSAVIFLWNREERQKRIVWIYIILLFILVPLSFLNYLNGDWFFARYKQAFVDLIICLLGLFLLFRLINVKTSTVETSVMKGLAIFLIVSEAVLVPGIYCILWLFNMQGLISLAKTKHFDATWITYVTGIGGLIISILNYNLSILKEKKST